MTIKEINVLMCKVLTLISDEMGTFPEAHVEKIDNTYHIKIEVEDNDNAN